MHVLNEAEGLSQTPNNKPRKRGGKRPGAGARKGKLNALKHGRYSQQFSRLGALFAREPRIREVLTILAERFDRERIQAQDDSAALLVHLVQTLKKRGDNSFQLDYIDDWQTIKRAAARADWKTAKRRLIKLSQRNDQSPDTNDPKPSNDQV
ncbi:MAG TPA: hypothetical protein VMR52_01285 [Dehalococcoidia bacterium]|nr:hypothetical protein [Dehalococcoidia bacterium]